MWIRINLALLDPDPNKAALGIGTDFGYRQKKWLSYKKILGDLRRNYYLAIWMHVFT